MAEIRGQRRKETLYFGILPVPLGHPMNRERMPQVMDARLKGRFIVAFNPREPSQANEALIQHSESDGISALRLEQRPIVLPAVRDTIGPAHGHLVQAARDVTCKTLCRGQ